MEELFDKSSEYDEMLNQGLSLSGEDKFFFIHGRFRDLSQIVAPPTINSILDFGCGIGDATLLLKQYFPAVKHITGIDTAEIALEYARKNNNDGGEITYTEVKDFRDENKFDLCYVNGVFHHIPLNQREAAIKIIYDALKPGGVLAFFENNPINPGTRLVMSRIPFDKDAITLTHWQTHKLLTDAGFKVKTKPRFLFYFPNALKFLRPLEKFLVHMPLGAQYYLLGEK